MIDYTPPYAYVYEIDHSITLNSYLRDVENWDTYIEPIVQIQQNLYRDFFMEDEQLKIYMRLEKAKQELIKLFHLEKMIYIKGYSPDCGLNGDIQRD